VNPGAVPTATLSLAPVQAHREAQERRNREWGAEAQTSIREVMKSLVGSSIVAAPSLGSRGASEGARIAGSVELSG
jgi:hypothetical protein